MTRLILAASFLLLSCSSSRIYARFVNEDGEAPKRAPAPESAHVCIIADDKVMDCITLEHFVKLTREAEEELREESVPHFDL
jgi:hypothetical protein